MALNDVQPNDPLAQLAQLDPQVKAALLNKFAGLVGGQVMAPPMSDAPEQHNWGTGHSEVPAMPTGIQAMPQPNEQAPVTPAPQAQAAPTAPAPVVPTPQAPIPGALPGAQPFQMAQAPAQTIMSPEDFAKSHPAVIPGAPVGPFDTSKHPKLMKLLTLLGAGAAEIGGRDPWGSESRPGMGSAVLAPWIQSVAAKRAYQTNAPAMQQQAQDALYTQYLKGEQDKAAATKAQAEATYYSNLKGAPISQGFAVGPGGQLVPINPSAVQQSKISQEEAQAQFNKAKTLETTELLPWKEMLTQADTELKQSQAALERAKNDPHSAFYQTLLVKQQMAMAHLGLAQSNAKRAYRDFMIKSYNVDPETQPNLYPPELQGNGGGGASVTVSGKENAPAIQGPVLPNAPGAPQAQQPPAAPASAGHVPVNAQGQPQTPQGAPLKEFNLKFVEPNQPVEKSYQMFERAYQEAKAGSASGAPGMVGLSTHLATTFGNVKGSRITKDMIQEHLGARSVSDDALVAIQKFTNGDPLSPSQWNAFRQLITDSRNLSWDQAAQEAERRGGIPLDFMPGDRQAKGPNGHMVVYDGRAWVDSRTYQPVK